jgi:hypothetical protein
MTILGTFKLRNPTMAMTEHKPKRVVVVPADAEIVVIAGDIAGDSFITIRYFETVLLIRRDDFRYGIGLDESVSMS